MSLENNAVENRIIQLDGKSFWAQFDRSGELVKTWEAGPAAQSVEPQREQTIYVAPNAGEQKV
jgi:hypothetical protein